MNMLTRYAPFGILTAGMMTLVMVAPSKAPVAANNPFATYNGDQSGVAGSSSTTGGQTPEPGASGIPGVTALGSAGSTKSKNYVTSNTGRPAGDTSHCVNGKQFGELITSPPCTPAFAGDNGGATWSGVTRDKIEIVYYREKDNPAVAAIEQGAGLYSNPSDQQTFLQTAAMPFVNKHYELYGRKINIDFYAGACSPAPPDPACYRTDADKIVDQYHPYLVIYDNNTNSPDFFDELSRRQVTNWGGWHWEDNFFQQHRPWHYDVYMSGDYQAELTGEWWCKKMAGKPARFAGDVTLQHTTRKTSIQVPNYPVVSEPAYHLMNIINGCAPGTAEVEPYSSDTATASAQATAHVAKEQQDGITSILWFSDPIAPVYGTHAQSSQRYFPEEVLVGSGLLDYDVLGQLYSPDEWSHAFGPSDLGNAQNFTDTDAAKVWHDTGHTGDPYSSANLPWSYVAAISYMLNQTGPRLNPGTFEHAAFNGPWPNAYRDYHINWQPYTKWGPAPDSPGAYAGISDARQVYWDPNKTSPINGKQGAYVGLDNGARYMLGGWTPGEPNLPPGV